MIVGSSCPWDTYSPIIKQYLVSCSASFLLPIKRVHSPHTPFTKHQRNRKPILRTRNGPSKSTLKLIFQQCLCLGQKNKNLARGFLLSLSIPNVQSCELDIVLLHCVTYFASNLITNILPAVGQLGQVTHTFFLCSSSPTPSSSNIWEASAWPLLRHLCTCMFL